MELKNYQIQSLESVADFLQQCRTRPVAEVYAERSQRLAQQQLKYFDYLKGAPAICLRVPTGGGKTIIAAAAVKTIDDVYTQTGAPLVVWLTPSDAITQQTFKGLSDTKHAYRQRLDSDFGAENVKVCTPETLNTLSPDDFGRRCIILVATNQTFNISKTTQRNIYAFNETLERFFVNLSPSETAGLEVVTADDIEDTPDSVLTQNDIGRVKYSAANLLSLYHPIVIVDEAHNGRTDTFFATLQRLHPSVCLDLTATPVPKNNVIHSVSAWELKSENMIKLPVILGEHTGGWENCLMEAVALQQRLEGIASEESDYIRPIVLIQAEQKNKEPGYETVKSYLINTLHISEAQIAVQTGKIKELTGKDLKSSTCPIRFVITVEALKEGWDCPFAYILCGLQPIQSAKDIEQLLGRVLRMPYAKARSTEALRLSYAQIVSEQTMALATLLKDRIVTNMGFNAMEAADFIEDQTPATPKPVTPDLPGIEIKPSTGTERPLLVPLKVCDLESLKTAVAETPAANTIKVTPQAFAGNKFNVVLSVSPKATDESLQQLTQTLLPKLPAKEKQFVKEQLEDLRNQLAQVRPPVTVQPFPAIPLLCFKPEDGDVRVLDRQSALTTSWNPNLCTPRSFSKDFTLEDSVQRTQIDIDDAHHLTQTTVAADGVTERFIQRSLKGFDNLSVNDLIAGIVQRIRREDVTPTAMTRFVSIMVQSYFIGEKHYSVAQLYTARVKVENALKGLLKQKYDVLLLEGFQEALALACDTPENPDYEFRYDPAHYPANNVYQLRGNSIVFKKHLYPQIHDLQYLTEHGKVTEEYRCAEALENCPWVKRWVRNIEKNPYSFRLPLSSRFFYPDFVAELTDGRILVVEYKGADRESTDDSREKRHVGRVWEAHSHGRGVFLFGLLEDDQGRNIAQQIEDAVQGRSH